MKSYPRKFILWPVVAAGVCLCLAGCDDSAKKPAQVRPPQISVPVQEGALAPLPINSEHRILTSLTMQAPDGANQLAGDVQAAFDAGEEDFRAGHLEKARQEFDDALDELLTSGYDLEADAQLGSLYRHIIDTVSLDELEAFRAGDGFSEQKSTPAAIDEIAEQPIPEEVADPSLRVRAEGEVRAVSHDLPLTVNDQVLAFLNYFKSPRGSAIVETGLRRSGRYRDMVRRVLKEEGLPEDLIYLAQAESAFQPQAVSRAGARGMWQFMSFAGHKYGLQKTWWVDERQDPEKATRAAARDLRDLYDQFGDWYLAMAAYNSGAGAVQHAVERTGYADFWELHRRNVLPRETQNYVPIILALALVSKDPARYGIEPDPEPPLKADLVKPGQAIDLRLVAETIDTDLESLRSLNPELLRLVTPPDPDFVLRLPEGSAERFFAEIAAIPPEKWVSWRRHKVEQGETLSSIARQYRVTAAEVAEANELAPGETLEEGQKLIIPAAARAEAATGKVIRYRVRRTDTISTIADEFDVTPAELRKWNHLKANRVPRGASLRIYPGGMTPPPAVQQAKSRTSVPAPEAATAARRPAENGPVMEAGPANPVVHHVKAGETLWSIARAYQTTVEAIQAGNRFLFSRPLQVGDTLTILPAR